MDSQAGTSILGKSSMSNDPECFPPRPGWHTIQRRTEGSGESTITTTLMVLAPEESKSIAREPAALAKDMCGVPLALTGHHPLTWANTR